MPQAGHHFFREKPGGMHAFVFRHVPHLHQAKDVADAEGFDEFLHPLAHGFRSPGDHPAAFDQLAPGNFLKDSGGRVLTENTFLNGFNRSVTRRIGESRENVKATIVKVTGVFRVEAFRVSVGISDTDELSEAGSIG